MCGCFNLSVLRGHLSGCPFPCGDAAVLCRPLEAQGPFISAGPALLFFHHFPVFSGFSVVFAAACHFRGRQYLQAASDLLACFAYVCQQDSNHLHLKYRM